MHANINAPSGITHSEIASNGITLGITRSRVQSFFEKMSKIMAIICILFIPISTSLLNISLVLLVISWILAGELKNKFAYSLQHPVGKYALLFFCFFLVACLYSVGPLKETMSLLIKMSKLFAIIIFLPLMREKNWRYYGCIAFIFSMFFSLILGIAKQYLGLPLYLSHASSATVFKSYIDTNLMMALSTFILAQSLYLPLSRYMKYFVLGIMFLMTLYILWLSEGRAGYFVFMGLWILFCIQNLSWKQTLLGVLALAILLGAATVYSSKFYSRLIVLPQQIQQYKGGELNSVAERLDYCKHTFELSKEHPWFGWGTGSLKTVYAEYAEKNHLKSTSNPHNEYLNVAFQLGLVGLCMFLYFLWTILKTSLKLPLFEGKILQGLVLALMMGSIANSWLMDFTSGYLFVILTATCAAALAISRREASRERV